MIRDHHIIAGAFDAQSAEATYAALVSLSQEFLVAVEQIEVLASNQDGSDNSWRWEAMEHM